MRFALALVLMASTTAAPVFLDDQFEMPAGFRIYRAAERELTGGSYALTFDGSARLLVGDGTAVRRLKDENKDGVFEGYEVIATGLGWRGPQGILVYGDRLFAVGGDGIQLYEGYTSGQLRHVGRVGEKLNTGGDHDAHTLLRGVDGYIYFMAGNGSGLKDRQHITAPNSPARFEREATVFRISPDGKRWESIATGGRNPPSLGMNYLGDLFSFDSDMEWHVGLPFYRPVRLNHWVVGGDQGWHDVGALPPYYLDNLPGLVDIGRGSPNWGIFYEHTNLPQKHRNAFLCTDYRWKSESTDDYRSTGRLVAFHLQRSGARWKAEMETLVRPKPGAKDQHGRAIPFALVDVTVAHDGSLYFTEHNQGVWRVFYDPNKTGKAQHDEAFRVVSEPMQVLLNLPQLGSEISRIELDATLTPETEGEARRIATTPGPLDKRIQCIRILARKFHDLDFIEALAKDKEVEIRAMAAWLAGIKGDNEADLLPALLKDEDPFVRRRAAEGLMRHASLRFVPELEVALADSDRTVRYTAMMVLTHLPIGGWFYSLAQSTNTQVILRALTAAHLRNEKPRPEAVEAAFAKAMKKSDREDELNLLRVIHLYNHKSAVARIRQNFPSGDAELDWERARLLGEFGDGDSFPLLLKELRAAKDPVRQFHYFTCIAKLKSGWTPQTENELLDFALSTQQGWFAEFNDKGVEFPLFLQTALDEFAATHSELVIAAANRIQLESLLGGAYLSVVRQREPARLYAMYASEQSEPRRIKILQSLAALPTEQTAALLRKEISAAPSGPLRVAALKSLAAMPKSPENTALLQQPAPAASHRSNEEMHAAIMSASLDAGEARRGRRVYEKLLCNTCHGGGQTPGQEGRIFGPDLVGATARLTRAQLADALVYPSKEVADRFKAAALTLKDGRELTGFVTEKSASAVTFIDASTIHKIAPSEIEKLAPQEKSLMPEGLLNNLTDQEIAHLLKFLSTMGL